MVQEKAHLQFAAVAVDAISQLKFANSLTHHIYIQDLTLSDYRMFHHKSSLWLNKIFPVMTNFRTRCIIDLDHNGKILLRLDQEACELQENMR